MKKEDEIEAAIEFMTSNKSFAGDFFKFLTALDTKYKCVFCGSESLTAAIYFSQGTEYLPTFMKARIKDGKIIETQENFGMPMLHVSCDKCGHISLFDADVYKKWKATQND